MFDNNNGVEYMCFIKGLQQNTRIWSYKCRRSCTLDHVFVLLFYCNLYHMFCFRLSCTQLQKRNNCFIRCLVDVIGNRPMQYNDIALLRSDNKTILDKIVYESKGNH